MGESSWRVRFGSSRYAMSLSDVSSYRPQRRRTPLWVSVGSVPLERGAGEFAAADSGGHVAFVVVERAKHLARERG